MSTDRPADAVTWRQVWRQLTPEFDRAQARWLCEVASGCSGAEFLAELDRPATARMMAHLDAMLARARAGEPLQYVLGRWGFRRLDLMVDRRVLIPRPETELVVETALGLVRGQRPLLVADLGCGSGAIGLALADELPREGTTVWLTDVSSDAIDVARANAAGLGRAAANVRFGYGSWFAPLPATLAGSFHLIVSNPPYVAEGSPDLEPIVADYEPAVALYGGADGLDPLRTILAGAGAWLAPGGWLVCEVGADQGAAVRSLANRAGLSSVDVIADLAGRDRILVARRE